MDILKLYRDYGIIHLTEGHKHCRDGWVNTICPHCTGNPGYHLSYSLTKDRFVCWRCGGHGTVNTLAKILNVHSSQAVKILQQYNYTPVIRTLDKAKEKRNFQLPTNTVDELLLAHRKYLVNRNFDPDELQEKWDLKSTGIYSKLYNLDFSWRLIAPIYWNGQLVTFQGRKISDVDNGVPKYMACPEEVELLSIKSVVYGKPEHWTDICLVTEGITDVWRMGEESVGLFGIKYTVTQLRILAKYFKRIFVMFDDDPQAIIQAHKLKADLRMYGVEVIVLEIDGDPGSFTEQQAAEYMRDIKTFRLK